MFTHPKKISSVILTAFLLNACSTTDTSNKRLVTEKAMDQLVEQQREHKATAKTVPAEVNKALLDNQALASGGLAKINHERFDVSVRNVAAKDFFLGLVSGTGVNVVVHPDVNGSVTLDLKNVTVDDVLRVTRDIYGYEFKKERDIYTIYANAMRTEVFQINYLDVQRVGVSDTSVMIGRAQSSGSGNNSNSNSGGGGNSTNENANLLGMIENAGQGKESGGGSALTPGSRVQNLIRTDFWSSLEKTVVSIIVG